MCCCAGVPQVGPWSPCSGDNTLGRSSRVVSCVDSAGQVVTAGSDTCASQQPSSSALCWTEAAKMSCSPATASSAQGTADVVDCYGHGLCGAAGCECKDGWHGQFCEVAARCKGVMDRRDRCCSSGVLNITGECCPSGSVLDGAGACCTSGQVDACGKCDGAAWSTDITVSDVSVETVMEACYKSCTQVVWCNQQCETKEAIDPVI